jgi:hypothetical protein
MKAKDLILIALVCANVTLASVALAIYIGKAESTAVAANASRAGDYVMVTGAISNSREALLVIDVVAKRANLYTPKAAAAVLGQPGVGGWELTSSRNLATDFSSGGVIPK